MHVGECSIERLEYESRILTSTWNSFIVPNESSYNPLPWGIACEKFVIATRMSRIQNVMLHFPSNAKWVPAGATCSWLFFTKIKGVVWSMRKIRQMNYYYSPAKKPHYFRKMLK